MSSLVVLSSLVVPSSLAVPSSAWPPPALALPTSWPSPARALPTASQLVYQRRELSLFLHFSICTYAGCEQNTCDSNPASLFNPGAMNVTQWVSIAIDAGAEEICLTARHSGGFALWPSRHTNYSVAQSPWREGKGDVIAEFVAASVTAYKVGVGQLAAYMGALLVNASSNALVATAPLPTYFAWPEICPKRLASIGSGEWSAGNFACDDEAKPPLVRGSRLDWDVSLSAGMAAAPKPVGLPNAVRRGVSKLSIEEMLQEQSLASHMDNALRTVYFGTGTRYTYMVRCLGQFSLPGCHLAPWLPEQSELSCLSCLTRSLSLSLSLPLSLWHHALACTC